MSESIENGYRKDQTYKGYETAKTALTMSAKMHVHLFLGILALHFMLTFVFSAVFFKGYWCPLAKYTLDSLLAIQWPTVLEPALMIIAKKSVYFFIISVPVWLLYPVILRKLKERARKQSADIHVRGRKKVMVEELKAQIRKSGEPVDLPLGEAKMPVSAEPKHVLNIGRPGTGKTNAESQAINRLDERGSKGIIYDFKGDYLSKFYDPTRDLIFNPLDIRCQGWNIFNELTNFMDVDAVAHSLIPPAYTGDPFFNDAARDVFSGILHHLYQQGKRTNADIWRAVTADKKDIAKWLSQTKGGERGYSYISDASSKQALGVIATIMQYTKSFEFMAGADGSFSIKQWLEDGKPGFIFVTNYSDVKDTLRPILSLFIDLMGRKLLSMPEDYNRRVFFMLDEFGTLQRLPTIVNLLTLSRSKGGSVWIGIQDIGQIDKIYTFQIRQSIVNACGTTLIFSVADPDTARFLSDKIGEWEYIETEETQSMGPEDMRDGISLVRRKKISKLFLPSEIQMLPDLHAYLCLPNYDVAPITFKYRKFEDKHAPFSMRPELSLDAIMAEQQRILAESERLTGGSREQMVQELKNRLKNKGSDKGKDRDEDDGREIADDLMNF